VALVARCGEVRQPANAESEVAESKVAESEVSVFAYRCKTHFECGAAGVGVRQLPPSLRDRWGDDANRNLANAFRPTNMTKNRNIGRLTWTGQAPLITLVILCVVTALLTSRFLSPLNLTNILVQSSIMAVIAMGMTFVIVGGGFDLSVGSTVALSGCIAAMVMIKYGIVLGVIAGVIAGAGVGLANGLVIAALRVNPFIATLGSMVLVRGVVYIITGGAPVSGEDGLPGAFVAFGSARLLGIHYLVWVPAILLVALSLLLSSTPYGRRIYATGGNKEAAYLSGVAVDRIVASTYIWCGALAGVAGVMLAARLQSGQPTAGEFYELTAIAAVVLGGASLHGGEGALYKSVIGVFIMIVLGNGLNLLNVDSYWQRVAVGAVIIAAAAADRLRSRNG
jgi:ribose transport system permease protein